MVRFIGKAAFVMVSCVHSVQAETSGLCPVPDFGPNVEMSACAGLIPPDSCTVNCAAGYIGSPTTLHCYSDDDGFLGFSPDCSKGQEGVISADTSTSRRQMPADERQLNVKTTTMIPGSCSVPDLGNSIDASDCVGKMPGETCNATCASGFEGSEETYTCDGVQLTVLGTKPECKAKPFTVSSEVLQNVRSSLWSNTAANTRAVVEAVGDAKVVAEKVSLAAVVQAGGALTVEGNDTDGASVALPKALFDLLGSEVVVVMASDGKSMPNQESKDGKAIDVQGILSILVSTRGNANPTVSGLSTPITLALGTIPNSEGKVAVCVFYDETLKRWSSDGIKTIGAPPGPITCETTHLTTFGVALETPVVPVCGFGLGKVVYYGNTQASVTCYAKVNGADALGICTEGGGGHSSFSACTSEIKTQCDGKLMFVGCATVSEEQIESGSFRATATSMLGLVLAVAITLFV